MKNEQIFFSENPERDLWKELLQFTYEDNIKKYFEKNNVEFEDATIKGIIGSILQAYEYFKGSRSADLQIAPLLLYYGASNLTLGMSSLLNGKKIETSAHGMKSIVPDSIKSLGDLEVVFNNLKTGGVHRIKDSFGFEKDLLKYGKWTLQELLSSIAEINPYFCNCYGIENSKIIMLDEFNTPEGKVEKAYYNSESKEIIKLLLSKVEGYKSSYLNYTEAKDLEGNNYFVLRYKLDRTIIYEKSLSGQPYLKSSIYKNQMPITLPTILNIYIGLFILSNLCRYYPEKWSPFVLYDSTGERLLIDNFISSSRRIIPNIVLNRILGYEARYLSEMYRPKETIKLVGEHQIKELIREEIDKSRIISY